MAEKVHAWGGRCTLIAADEADASFHGQPMLDKIKPMDVADAVMHALNANRRTGVGEIFMIPPNLHGAGALGIAAGRQLLSAIYKNSETECIIPVFGININVRN